MTVTRRGFFKTAGVLAVSPLGLSVPFQFGSASQPAFADTAGEVLERGHYRFCRYEIYTIGPGLRGEATGVMWKARVRGRKYGQYYLINEPVEKGSEETGQLLDVIRAGLKRSIDNILSA